MTAPKTAVKKPKTTTQRPEPLPVTASPPAEPDRQVLGRLLRMADAYRKAGSIHHAVEMYFRLVEDHPGAPEADQARARLMEIAEKHELAAEPHEARSIYERLL